MKKPIPRLLRAFLATTSCSLAVWSAPASWAKPVAKPNFLVITLEDVSASRLGCYGDPLARTPTMDGLARDGVRFSQAIATAPVCAPSRCTLITGVDAVSLGGMHMRSNLRLPPRVKCFTQYLREAGYFTANSGKQDYQFVAPPGSWDIEGAKAHWRGRSQQEQPFYAVFNLPLTHQGSVRDAGYSRSGGKLPADQKTDPAKVKVPAFLPDTPIVRRDIARIYDNLAYADRHIAGILKQLEDDGLADQTIVIFLSDHGDGGMPRFKEYPYDSGLHVPLIIRAPKGMEIIGLGQPGTVDGQLVTFADIAPTVLALAGLEIPSYMQGRAIIGPKLTPQREFVVSNRDRGNDRYETLRAVTDERWLYVRHFQPWRPLMQPMCGFEGDTSLQELNRVAAEGKLPPLAEQFMTLTQPVEELFDRMADPDNVHNLVGKPEHREVLETMRKRLDSYIAKVGDLGFVPEDMLKHFVADVKSERAVGMGHGGKYNALEASRWASLGHLEPFDLAKARQGLTSTDPVARYWSAIAVATQDLELPADSPVKDELRKLLADPFGDVQAAAAFAMVRTGLDPDAGLETFRSLLIGKRRYATLNALNLIDLIPKELAAKLRPEIQQLAKLEFRSIADAERYVRDLSRNILKTLPRADPS